MKEFKEEKRELEIQIRTLITAFCNKYNVTLEDIDIETFLKCNGSYYDVKLKFDI